MAVVVNRYGHTRVVENGTMYQSKRADVRNRLKFISKIILKAFSRRKQLVLSIPLLTFAQPRPQTGNEPQIERNYLIASEEETVNPKAKIVSEDRVELRNETCDKRVSSKPNHSG